MCAADDQEKQDAIRRMTELMATQENIVPTMRDNDQQVRATVVGMDILLLLVHTSLSGYTLSLRRPFHSQRTLSLF